MLTGFISNRNVERILLFLFVNEKCYGTQLQSLLQIPLTPIQKALLRLEKGGVIQSHTEGKTRIFRLNPSYPLRFELEALLKKVYTLLPSQEKKKYCFIHKPRIALNEEGKRERDRRDELSAFWETLQRTCHLSFSAKTSQGNEKLTKIGQAEVQVICPAPEFVIFQEKGIWLLDPLPNTSFNNSFRWTRDLKASLITLEHLRYGPAHPVFLFHLTPTKSGLLEAVDPHLCGEDTYLGSIAWSYKEIYFYWRIIGPRKNDELTYHYY